MIEGLDYCYIYPKKDDGSVHIKFLEGIYKDTIFKFGKVKIFEENGQAYLHFGYTVLESRNSRTKFLEKDKAFKDYLGDLLVEIMSGNLEQDIIDETGTDDSQESDLQ